MLELSLNSVIGFACRNHTGRQRAATCTGLKHPLDLITTIVLDMHFHAARITFARDLIEMVLLIDDRARFRRRLAGQAHERIKLE